MLILTMLAILSDFQVSSGEKERREVRRESREGAGGGGGGDARPTRDPPVVCSSPPLDEDVSWLGVSCSRLGFGVATVGVGVSSGSSAVHGTENENL